MKFNVCQGTTNNLITVVNAENWQKAKSLLKNEGYFGKYILEECHKNGFKIINVNINQFDKKPIQRKKIHHFMFENGFICKQDYKFDRNYHRLLFMKDSKIIDIRYSYLDNNYSICEGANMDSLTVMSSRIIGLNELKKEISNLM